MKSMSAKSSVVLTVFLCLIQIAFIVGIAIAFDIGRTPGLLYLWTGSIIGMLVFTLVGAWQCFVVIDKQGLNKK